jgi:hypothetical protein
MSNATGDNTQSPASRSVQQTLINCYLKTLNIREKTERYLVVAEQNIFLEEMHLRMMRDIAKVMEVLELRFQHGILSVQLEMEATEEEKVALRAHLEAAKLEMQGILATVDEQLVARLNLFALVPGTERA